MAKHVGVNLERHSGALANALNQAIDGVRGERSAPLGRKHKAAVITLQ
jgi:hypothetical protein